MALAGEGRTLDHLPDRRQEGGVEGGARRAAAQPGGRGSLAALAARRRRRAAARRRRRAAARRRRRAARDRPQRPQRPQRRAGRGSGRRRWTKAEVARIVPSAAARPKGGRRATSLQLVDPRLEQLALHRDLAHLGSRPIPSSRASRSRSLSATSAASRTPLAPPREPMRRPVQIPQQRLQSLAPRISRWVAASSRLAQKRPQPASAPPPPARGAHAARPEASGAPGLTPPSSSIHPRPSGKQRSAPSQETVPQPRVPLLLSRGVVPASAPAAPTVLLGATSIGALDCFGVPDRRALSGDVGADQ